MKKHCLLLSSLCLALLLSFPAAAAENGSWVRASDGRWWYQCADGTYPHAGWEVIDGSYYYFDADGWMLADTVTPDGFRVDADGRWVEDTAAGGAASTERAVPAAEVLRGLVADDILSMYRNSGKAGVIEPDGAGICSIEKAAYDLGLWAEGRLGTISGPLAEKALRVNNSHEWCFGTDISNNTEANFPYYYAYYFALKDYYASGGQRSAGTMSALVSDASIFYDTNPEARPEQLYTDLRDLITAFNNAIRSQR